MKLIFISGPSGSGKTTLSNQIIKKNKNGIVLSTDNYYKTGLISKLLPNFVEGFFDRSISFNNKLFKKDFDFIYKNGISIYNRYYNFEKKTIQNILKETNNISFLIVVFVFADFPAFFSIFKGVSGDTALLNKIDFSLLRNLVIIAKYMSNKIILSI